MTQFGSSDDIKEWLIQRLCFALSISDIDADTPFSRYALDSMGSLTLVMDVEDQLQIEMPPTLFWDYPTVNKCVSYLVSVCQGSGRLDAAAAEALAD